MRSTSSAYRRAYAPGPGGAPRARRCCGCGLPVVAIALAFATVVIAANLALVQQRACNARVAALQAHVKELEAAAVPRPGDEKWQLPPPPPVDDATAMKAGGLRQRKAAVDASPSRRRTALRQPPSAPAAVVAPPPPPPPPPPPAVVPAAVAEIEAAPTDTSAARALLVICYNRPDYLRRTLDAVARHLPTYNRPHVYISRDGDVPAVGAVVDEWVARMAAEAPDVPVTVWRHPAADLVRAPPGQPWAAGYYALSQHFRWALRRLFAPPAAHPRVIVLEDDLEVRRRARRGVVSRGEWRRGGRQLS